MITLTVVSRGGQSKASVATPFDPAQMVFLEPDATDATKSGFYYPNGKGGYDPVIVSESSTAVQTLMGSVSTATTKKQATVLFDATGGKAIAAYSGVDKATGAAITIPLGARITRAWYVVLTTFTSATDAATISIGNLVDDVAGIKAAVAISNGANPWDAGAPKDCIQDGTAAAIGELLTAARAITFTVAVEALTAGKLALVVEYTENLN